jgi:hypothetical protein
MCPMGSISKERLWGSTVRAADQRAKEARQVADVAACDAWNLRMRVYGGPAQPSPLLGDVLNAGFIISRSNAPAARRTRRSICRPYDAPRKRRSGSLSTECVAAPVRISGAIGTSAVILCGCGRPTSRRPRTASLGILTTNAITTERIGSCATSIRLPKIRPRSGTCSRSRTITTGR